MGDISVSVNTQTVERVVVEDVVTGADVYLENLDAGEVRRLHRIILAGVRAFDGGKTGVFGARLIDALGITEASAAKQ